MSTKTKLFAGLAVALAAGLLVVAYLLGRGGVGPIGPKPSPSPREVVRANFTAGEVRAIDSLDRPEAVAAANENAPRIIDILNSFYNTAFVDNEMWSNGTHPGLGNFFTNEAQPTVGATANLGSLALADLAPAMKSVKPTRQEAPKISFIFEPDLSIPSVIVTSIFEAEGTTRAAKAGPVKIVHQATFWLVRDGDSYRITAYAVQLNAESVTRRAAFGEIQEVA